MFRFFIAITVAGILGMVGYGIGAALTDDTIWALALGAVGFALGFALSAMVGTKARQDEHPSTRNRSF